MTRKRVVDLLDKCGITPTWTYAMIYISAAAGVPREDNRRV